MDRHSIPLSPHPSLSHLPAIIILLYALTIAIWGTCLGQNFTLGALVSVKPVAIVGGGQVAVGGATGR